MPKKRAVKPRGVPPILPREPLTKKARAAIERYVLVRCGEARIIHFLIKYTLEAERMRRADLYAWLEARGWRWNSRWNIWKGKEES